MLRPNFLELYDQAMRDLFQLDSRRRSTTKFTCSLGMLPTNHVFWDIITAIALSNDFASNLSMIVVTFKLHDR